MTSSETAFAEQALGKGYVTRDQIDACLRRQEELREAGEDLGLGQVLVREGHITANQFMVLQIGPAIAAEELPPPETEAAPFPRPLGKYVLKREIARGGMGVVYEAEDTQLRRHVALKTLRDDEADRELVERLRREATIAAQFAHPNIVAIHEVGTMPNESGRPVTYLAMDYVEGRTLADLIRDGTTKRKDLVRKLEAVARAAAYAHSKGVVHRDLKPANVLVDKDGRAMLTDFGLARAESVSAQTCSGIVMGTPQYMAPEQVEGKSRQIDARTDVYALGVILYEILAGRPPFWAPTPAKLYTQILNDEPVRPTRLSKTVNADLETVCLKAMEKRREDRYASAASFADDLRRFLEGEPILASRIGWSRRIGRKLRRHRALVATAASCALLLLAGAATSAVLELRHRNRMEGERRIHGRQEEALKDLAALSSSVTNLNQGLRSARVSPASARKAFGEALIRIEEHIRNWPDEPQGYYVRARTHLSLGNLEAAEESARTAVRKKADFRPGWSLLGLIGLKRYALALYGPLRSAADRSRKLTPILERAADALSHGGDMGRMYEEMQRWGLAWSDEELAQMRVTRALRLYYVEEKRDEARELLLQEWNNLQSEEYALWIGDWSREAKEKNRWYTEALKRAPGFFEARFDRGLLRLRVKKYKEALEDLDAAVDLNPEFPDTYTNRGVAHRRLGQPEKAIRDHTRAIELVPSDGDAYYNRGNVFRDQKRYAEALDDYDRAVELGVSDSNVFYGRATARKELGRTDEALLDYGRAIEIGGDDVIHAHNDRGALLMESKRWTEALADFQQAIELDAKCAPAYLNRGTVRLRLGHPAEAIDDLDHALEIQKDSAEAYLRRGTAKLALDRLEGAIADLDQALLLRPDDPDALGHRGLAKKKKGDLAGARTDLERAVKLVPKDWPERRTFVDAKEEVHRQLGIHP